MKAEDVGRGGGEGEGAHREQCRGVHRDQRALGWLLVLLSTAHAWHASKQQVMM